jgi:uncharacterized protein DUF2628
VTVYTVYEPPGEETDLAARAAKVAFVKDGFSWPALFVPMLWLIFQRMWLELIVFFVVIFTLPWLFGAGEQARDMAGWATIALTVLFAFEANDLRGWALQRRGYRFAGVTSGRDRVEAERAFFGAWLPEQQRAARRITPPAMSAPQSKAKAPSPPRQSGGDEVIGSFPRA